MTNTVNREIAQHILDAISNIEYGAVEVLIHDSQIVQIERKEKKRFTHHQKTN